MHNNRIIKKITVFILTFMLIFSVNLFGCTKPSFNEEAGYFIGLFDPNKMEVSVNGLTDLGKQQEILIIPEEINGYKVKYICTPNAGQIDEKYGEGHGYFSSKNLKRLYMPYSPLETVGYVTSPNSVFWGETKIEAFVAMELGSNAMRDWYNSYLRIPLNKFSIEKESSSEIIVTVEQDGRIPNILPANVSYLYNYEGAPNDGYYWVDDYDGELISYIPKDPTRVGYTFAGWYKEPECLNKWNFEVDVIPEKDITERSCTGETYYKHVYEYKETRLFAMWVEK